MDPGQVYNTLCLISMYNLFTEVFKCVNLLHVVTVARWPGGQDGAAVPHV